MRTHSPTLMLIGSLALFTPAGTAAQQVDRGDVQTLRELAARPDQSARDRATVRSFLARPDVKGTAAEHGIDLDRIADRVATLDSTQAADLAERVRGTEQQLSLVGGDTFVITSTTVIIALLIIILIVVS